MKVKSGSEVTQSCLTPSDRMDCSPPVSSVHGILQARALEWGAKIIIEDILAFSKQGEQIKKGVHGFEVCVESQKRK